MVWGDEGRCNSALPLVAPIPADLPLYKRMDLLETPGGIPVAEIVGVWWVALTRVGEEKAFAARVASQGLDWFLPLQRVVRRSGRTRNESAVALFPGYAFVVQPEGDRDGSRLFDGMTATRRCLGLINVCDQRRFRAELDVVWRALQHARTVEPYPTLPVGGACRITAGHPMEGIEGIVIERAGETRFVLQLTGGEGGLLTASYSFEIDPGFLEPLDN